MIDKTRIQVGSGRVYRNSGLLAICAVLVASSAILSIQMFPTLKSLGNSQALLLGNSASHSKKHHHKDPPMGVADLGNNAGSPYQYYAEAFEGTTQFNRLYLDGCTGNDPACIVNNQLNSIAIMFECNTGDTFCGYGYYWVQDLTFISQTGATSFNIGLWDNVWNMTTGCGQMNQGSVSGDGSVVTSGCQTFYEAFASFSLNATLPFILYLGTKAFTNSGGNAELYFSADVCYGQDFGTCQNGGVWDEVTFGGFGKACSSCTGEDTFVVGGTGAQLTQDVENILGGMWNAETIGIPVISVNMALYYAPQFASTCCSTFVPHAYSYGVDTAETATGVQMSMPNGCCIAFGESGTDDSVQLY